MSIETNPENSSLALRALNFLKAELKNINVELCESGGKQVIICDYNPVNLPHHPESDNQEQFRYRKFFETYQAMLASLDTSGENISTKGYTDLIDVREVRFHSEVVYVMPRSEWEKLRGQPLSMKNEKIDREIQKWFQHHRDLFTDEDVMAAQALLGKYNGQLVPLTAGLKPLSIDTPIDHEVKECIKSVPHLKFFIHSSEREQNTQEEATSLNEHSHGVIEIPIVYNSKAVRKIVNENKDIFVRLKLPSWEPHQIVNYFAKRHTVPNYGFEKGDKKLMYHKIAKGLLFGYDRQSCIDYAEERIDFSQEEFMPPDHAGIHPVKANPFNFYDVDYWVNDPENNQEFQALKKKYEDLVKKIETLLESGLSPADTLAALNEDYPEIRDETADDANRAIRLDLCDKNNLHKFISDCLTAEEENSRTQHNHPDLRDVLPALVDKITDFLLPHMPLEAGSTVVPFHKEVNLIILNAIRPSGGTAFASNMWAGNLLNSILNNQPT